VCFSARTWENMIYIRSPHFLSIFYRLYYSPSASSKGINIECIRCLSGAFQKAYACLVCWIL